MSGELDPLLLALRAVNEPADPSTKIATVTAYDSTGILVRFDGEGSASTKRYKNTHPVFVGMRVLMTRAGSTWVVNGDVDGSPAFIDATYINGWQTLSGNAAYRLQYRRNQGMVTVRGVVVPTVSWTSMWTTFPAGYRPDQDNVRFSAIQGGPDTTTQGDLYSANGNMNTGFAAATRNGISVSYLAVNFTFAVGA